jgi:ABC transporter with metal-binding/Fe-S-binding domain ATP-binding protein
MHMAAEAGDEVACLVTLLSENPESYMFHTPNIHLTRLQAEAIGLPHVARTTKGEKEAELDDLRAAIEEAVSAHRVDGVVTGAVASVYQQGRVQRICDGLGLRCLSPLWQRDQLSVLHDLLRLRFEVIVSGVFAPPLDGTWLGRRLDPAMVDELARLQQRWGINPAGEGGELETTVLWAPMFRRRLVLDSSTKREGPTWAVLQVERAHLAEP